MMWLVAALASLVGVIALFAVVCRLPIPGSSVAKFVVVAAAFGTLLAYRQLATDGSDVRTWAALALYAFAVELYLFLFTLVSSSVTVSLLLTLRLGRLAAAEVDRRYSEDKMVDNRVSRLLARGFLAQAQDHYRLTNRGRRLVSAFILLRGVFGHQS